MKKELAALALAGLVNSAAATEAPEGEKPQEPTIPTFDQPMIVSSRGRKFDLAPDLQGTRERRRATERGGVVELEIP